ncbi:fumarylacetoacetase [Salinactinospora qingdaonensis]|uniref:fumarylacetoacetase n=1 Tax=Salinactinospora qingdaonensis TaxID=702744 RepID=A0ABP7EWI8_9ACTN
MASWLPGADESGFGADNLPYGIFSRPGDAPRVGVRIGDFVLDLAAALGDPEFFASSLIPFMARGSTAWRATRAKVGGMLTAGAPQATVRPHLLPLDSVTLWAPFEVADYIDFSCSLEHATNLGQILRPDSAGLPANWRHLPVAHHGRSGTVVASGTEVTRPYGQLRAPGETYPRFGPSTSLDLGAALGFVVGAPTPLGRPVPVSEFAEHVFGVVLVNDWRAHDVQAWESGPLGPFLATSFATSISPWVVPLDALGAARFAGRQQAPLPMPHLRRVADWGLDIALEVRLNGEVVSRPPYAAVYWTPDQMLAHLTSNGAALRSGDLYASGTVSGARPDQRGSLLELSWGGAEPVGLTDGSTRSFLADGDTVTLSGWARGMAGGAISLGEVVGTVRAVA